MRRPYGTTATIARCRHPQVNEANQPRTGLQRGGLAGGPWSARSAGIGVTGSPGRYARLRSRDAARRRVDFNTALPLARHRRAQPPPPVLEDACEDQAAAGGGLEERGPGQEMRSGAPRCAPWLAERRQPRGLGPALALVDPSWDQGLVGAGQAAQFRHGLSLQLILPALVLAGAQSEPGGLGQQVGAAACGLAQFRRPGGLLRLSQAAPPGMTPGSAVKRGSPQPVRARSGAIPSHLTRIEHGNDKGKSAAFVSACPRRREG
jgi:hypothetical protein